MIPFLQTAHLIFFLCSSQIGCFGGGMVLSNFRRSANSLPPHPARAIVGLKHVQKVVPLDYVAKTIDQTGPITKTSKRMRSG